MRIYLLIFFLSFSSIVNADDYPESLFIEELNQINSKVIVRLEEIDRGESIEKYALGKTILIYKRTTEDLDYLSSNYKNNVIDPYNKRWKQAIQHRPSTLNAVWSKILSDTQAQYESITDRSLLRDYLIVLAHSPETSCRIYTKSKDKSALTEQHSVFYDICTGKQFDSAGRVLNSTGADHRNSFNLQIPPYKIINQNSVELGLTITKSFDQHEHIKNINYDGLNPQEKLWLAAHNNDLKTIKESIKQGASANKKETRANALDYAILGSNNEIISYLISKGAKSTEATKDMIEIAGRENIHQLITPAKN